MKILQYTFGLLLVLFLSSNVSNAQDYHFQDDFEDSSSDDFTGWTTGGEGVASTSKGITGRGAKFRGATSWLETKIGYASSKDLIFSLKVSDDEIDYVGATFAFYTSIDDGQTWDNIWSITQADLRINGTIIDSTISINSEVVVKLKFESNIPDSTIRSQYPFTLDNVSLTKSTIEADNVDILAIAASFKTVSSEEVIFSQTSSNEVYVSQDSIAIEEAENILTVTTLNSGATVNFTKVANPTPGNADTAIFEVIAADNSITKEYQVVVARSMYLCKIGFLNSGSGSITNGWTASGANYASSSKGHGGQFPGLNGMRIYKSDNNGIGSLTSPVYSSVKTLRFAAKFSKSDDESLIVQKSLDEGATWVDVKTYLPADGDIPAYSTEDAADSLAYQSLDINEENVMVRFQFIGTSTDPRTMIDDIACLANYNSDATFEVVVNVYDIDYQSIQGALVEVAGEQVTTGADGVAVFASVVNSTNVPYSISKGEAVISRTLNVSSNIEIERTLLSEEMDLFLALGQSNMAGRADINSYVSDEIENVSLLNDGAAWVTALNPMNIYSNIRKDASIQKVGPSYSFAKTLSKYIKNRIGMIVNARGGTNITAFAGEPYSPFIAQRIEESKMYGTIKGIIWHQGESNSSAAGAYMGHLAPLVDDLRTEIGEDVYFLAGQLGPWDKDGTTEPKYGAINDTIAQIANYVSNADYVKNNNLSDRGDNTHFNTESQVLLGQRYAQKVLKTTYSTEISIVELTIGETGYVMYGDEVITSDNDYSYTALTSEVIDFSIFAGEGKKFVSLNINGIDLADVAGDTVYTYTQSMSADAMLEISMSVEDQITSDVTNQLSTNLEFYPNPASGFITVNTELDVFEVIVFDLSGRKVLEVVNERNINIKRLQAGTYVIMLASENSINTNKLVVY